MRLGVAQISDGLVASPADARTRERLEWIANEAVEDGQRLVGPADLGGTGARASSSDGRR